MPKSTNSSDDGEDLGRVQSFMRSAGQKWSDFRKFLWDPTNKTVLGRGGKSWGRILVFYLFYYSFLAALFAASISIVLSTLDKNVPRFQTRLQTPGMSIQPRLKSSQALNSDIKFTKTDPASYKHLTDQMTTFLYDYALENQTAPAFKNCSNQKPSTSQKFKDGEINIPCIFNKNQLGPCAQYPYGYPDGKPCILVKLNRIINWYPVGFTDITGVTGTSESKAPPLTDVLAVRKVSYNPLLAYVACYGRKPDDMVNLNGDPAQVSSQTSYYPPEGGLEFKYYPYYGNNLDPNYRVPLVAVQFNNVSTGVDISVNCKVYAQNVLDDMRMRVGYYTFTMRID